MYYIVSHKGLLKLYYTTDLKRNNTNFSSSLRSAKTFKTVDEARSEIKNMQLENCSIIDINGSVQK